MAKYKVELNSVNNIRDLLQEAYMLSEEQVRQADREILKLSNSTQLQNEPMDAKAKYAKAINDYMSTRDKAISKKLEIAKLQKEVLAMNKIGKNESANMVANTQSLDFSKIKEMIDESYNDSNKKMVINKK